ncbi:MAG: hypothetical protein M3Z26_02235 [Bacteroidota bacterium]|nr:hypothetical protein [Bacteroidota bacterium]
MASFIADLAEGNISGFINSSENNLAVIHCKLNKTTESFSKVIIEFSLEARWQMMYNGNQLFLNKIKVQVGYKSDSGDINYKNSAIVANEGDQSAILPMIWTKVNKEYIYRATYTASQSMVLNLSYSVAFELNPDLPKELENAYAGNQDLAINPEQPFVDYSIKISIS